eukprot:SAG11_NODE_2368_length_3448_cov_12.401015_3_plen_73_part_00
MMYNINDIIMYIVHALPVMQCLSVSEVTSHSCRHVCIMMIIRLDAFNKLLVAGTGSSTMQTDQFDWHSSRRN